MCNAVGRWLESDVAISKLSIGRCSALGFLVDQGLSSKHIEDKQIHCRFIGGGCEVQCSGMMRLWLTAAEIAICSHLPERAVGTLWTRTSRNAMHPGHWLLHKLQYWLIGHCLTASWMSRNRQSTLHWSSLQMFSAVVYTRSASSLQPLLRTAFIIALAAAIAARMSHHLEWAWLCPKRRLFQARSWFFGICHALCNNCSVQLSRLLQLLQSSLVDLTVKVTTISWLCWQSRIACHWSWAPDTVWVLSLSMLWQHKLLVFAQYDCDIHTAAIAEQVTKG